MKSDALAQEMEHTPGPLLNELEKKKKGGGEEGEREVVGEEGEKKSHQDHKLMNMVLRSKKHYCSQETEHPVKHILYYT